MKMPLELPPGIANDDTGFAVARWADGDKVSIVVRNGAGASRRTAKMWGWDGSADA